MAMELKIFLLALASFFLGLFINIALDIPGPESLALAIGLVLSFGFLRKLVLKYYAIGIHGIHRRPIPEIRKNNDKPPLSGESVCTEANSDIAEGCDLLFNPKNPVTVAGSDDDIADEWIDDDYESDYTDGYIDDSDDGDDETTIEIRRLRRKGLHVSDEDFDDWQYDLQFEVDFNRNSYSKPTFDIARPDSRIYRFGFNPFTGMADLDYYGPIIIDQCDLDEYDENYFEACRENRRNINKPWDEFIFVV